MNNPPTAPNPIRTVTKESLTRNRHVNDLMAEFAARHPSDVVLLDLAEIVCPGGATIADPCPTTRDGIVLRPKDGGHFEAEGAAWTARRLLDALYAGLRDLEPAGSPTTATTRAP